MRGNESEELMQENPRLFELLNELSEKTVYDLLAVARRRARKQALRVRAGGVPDDLAALRKLQSCLQAAHDNKLLQIS